MIPHPLKPKEKFQKQRGLRYPKCGCEHFRVIYNRAWGGNLRQRRECRYCGHRTTTAERAQ